MQYLRGIFGVKREICEKNRGNREDSAGMEADLGQVDEALDEESLFAMLDSWEPPSVGEEFQADKEAEPRQNELKRARQREASRQSRKRRRDQIAALIDTTRSLQAQNQQLLQQLAALSSQPHSASPGSNPTAAAAFIAHAGRLFNHTIAVLNTGNLQQIRAVVKSVLTEDCTLLHPDLSSEIKGSDKIAEYFERMIEHFPDFTLAISKLESDPASSTVCAHFVATGTQLRPFLPILPASKPVTLEVTGYFFMADGFVRKQLWLWNHTRLLLSLIGYANCDSTSVLGIDTADLTKPRPESAASAGAASSSTMSTPTATKSESSSRDAEDSRTAPAR